MTVNKSHYLTRIATLLLPCFLVLSAMAQGPVGGYKDLITARGIAVSDTVEGVNLQVITIEPSAHHGNIDIYLVSAGNSTTPNRYEVRYTPNPEFQGMDTFTLELNQFFTFPYLHYQAYRVAVYPSQITLKDDYATTYVGTPIIAQVLSNDQCNNGPLTLSDIAVVNHGTAFITAQNKVQFTPQAGFSGVAQVNYIACDSSGFCKTGQLSIGVRPVTQPDDITLNIATAQNKATQATLQYGGYTMWQGPAHGSVQVVGGRAIRYKPDAGYYGPDPFILRRSVNGDVTTLTVNMQVLQTPKRNKMAVNDYVYTPLGTPVTFNVRHNDLGNLMVTQWGTIANGGSLSNTTPDGWATFTPDPDFTGTTVFQYALGNGLAGLIETAKVIVVVSNLNPAKDTFSLTTLTNAPFVVDYPIPFPVFDFEISQLPVHGTCEFYPGYSTQVIDGQNITGNNLLIYQPTQGFSGTDIFAVNYCLAANGDCQSTVIRMEVSDLPGASAMPCAQHCVWPGDANADGIVNNKDLLTMGFAMGQEGPSRTTPNSLWYAQQSNNWNNLFVPITTDLKYADTDGNGHITQADADIILQYYGQTDNLLPASPLTQKGLPFIFNLLTPNASIGDVVEVEVSLGSPAEPVINLYGMTFDALLSPNIVDSAFHMEFYDNSWINLNAPFLTLSTAPSRSHLESAFTRTNGQPVSGFGVIGKFSFVIIDILDVGRPDDYLFYNLSLSNSSVQWGDGVLTNGSNYELKIPLGLQNRAAKTVEAPQELLVYPSPTNHYLQVQMKEGNLLESVALYDLNGRLIQQLNGLSVDRTTLDVSRLSSGLYMVSAQTAQGTMVRKVQVVQE